MKLYILILAAFLQLLPDIYAQTPDFEWVKSSGGSGTERITTSAADSRGNIYVGGWFDSSGMEFGNDVSVGNYAESTGSRDAFIAKYSSAGEIIWALRIGEKGNDIITAITTDREGNIYACGNFNSTSMECGSTVLKNSGNSDCFVTKIDSAGTFIWAQKAGGTQDDFASSVAVDGEGNVVIAGKYSEKINFGDTISLVMSTYPGAMFFLAKYSSSGDVLWAKSAETTLGSDAIAVVADKPGNIYLSGSFLPKVIDFGEGITLTNIYPNFNAFSTDIFLAKYDAGGKPLWAKRIAAEGADAPNAIGLDSNNNIVLCGHFVGPAINFDAFTVKVNYSGGRPNYFVAKYDNNGDPLWGRSAEGQENGDENAWGIATDFKNNVYVSGHFFSSTGGPVSFGDNIFLKLPPPSNSATFIIKYDSLGKTLSGKCIPVYSRATLAVHGDEEIYLSGFFQGRAEFGNAGIFQNENNNSDVFTAKLKMGITSVADQNADLTLKPALEILPNPSNGFVTVNYAVSAPGAIRISLTDVLGRQTLLKAETLDAGEHSAEINTADFPAGIYVLTLEAEGQVFSQKVVIER
ncbi:MAG: SBBP repeat-containing protein [Bacteroidota bacterium]